MFYCLAAIAAGCAYWCAIVPTFLRHDAAGQIRRSSARPAPVKFGRLLRTPGPREIVFLFARALGAARLGWGRRPPAAPGADPAGGRGLRLFYILYGNDGGKLQPAAQKKSPADDPAGGCIIIS